MSTYDPVDDGTYPVAVVATNGAGASAAATVTATVDHAGVDPDGIDWSATFGPDQLKDWAALRLPLTQMDEATEFWPHVLTVLEDTAGDHGGVASYSDQLFLARLLTMWLPVPATPPREQRIADLADSLAQACSPPFPQTPPPSSASRTPRTASRSTLLDDVLTEYGKRLKALAAGGI